MENYIKPKFSEICQEEPNIAAKQGNNQPTSNPANPSSSSQTPPKFSAFDTTNNVENQADPSTFPEIKICIIGAGIAGLYTAMILDFLSIPNLTYEILESSDRVGGRIHTYHFSEEQYQYFDVGAMRFPRIEVMKPVYDLFERLGLGDRVIKYYHDSNDGVKSSHSCYNNIHHLSDTSLPASAAQDESIDSYKLSTANGGSIPDELIAIGAEEIMDSIYRPFKDALNEEFTRGWKKLMEQDNLTVRDYLSLHTTYDEPTIKWLETMTAATNAFNQGFIDNCLDNYYSSVPPCSQSFSTPHPRWVCLRGGSSILINAMLDTVSTKPKLNTRVSSISILPPSNASVAPRDRSHRIQITTSSPSFSSAPTTSTNNYTAIFSTTTLLALASIDLSDLHLSPDTTAAIEELSYDNSIKIGIRFRRAWWRDLHPGGGVGEAYTDIPIRVCVYPSYGLEDSSDGPAVLLCSYTWAKDAEFIGSLKSDQHNGRRKVGKKGEDKLLDLCIDNLARLHGNMISEDEIRVLVMAWCVWDWGKDDGAKGGVAMFGRGEWGVLGRSGLMGDLVCDQGLEGGGLWIVGEATSTAHSWVVGALNSVWRGVYLFLKKQEREDGLRKKFWKGRIEALIGEFGRPLEADVVLGKCG